MTTIRISTFGPEFEVHFEPWGNQYRVVEPDFVDIDLGTDARIEEISFHATGISLGFTEKPVSMVNSRGEHISV